MNPANIFQMMRGNPRQFIQQAMNNSKLMSNPMAKNALQMAQSGNAQGVEQIARNICKEKGLNPDDVLAQVKNRMGM